jgi:hypothetical protein
MVGLSAICRQTLQISQWNRFQLVKFLF